MLITKAYSAPVSEVDRIMLITKAYSAPVRLIALCS